MEIGLEVVLLAALAAICFGGLVLAVFQLPGTWLIVMAATGYDAYYGWSRLGAGILLGLAGLAAAAELGELLTGMLVAKRGGASRRASWYGLFGGMAGALLLSVPVPIFGTIAGAAIGCFAGAFIAEVQEGKDLNASTRSGTFSAVGRTLGSMLKLVAGTVIAGVVVVAAVVNFGG